MKVTTMVVVALMALLVAGSAQAAFVWKNLGADPFAKTREEAMTKRESAFKRLGLSPGVVAVAVEATKTPGVRIRLEPGSHLDGMMSGHRADQDVTVGITDGAEAWTIPGATVILPDGCFNWSYASIFPISRPAPITRTATVSDSSCVEIRLPALRQGDLGIKGFIAGPGGYDIANDQCLGLKEGNGQYEPLPNDLCSQTTPVFCDFRRIEAVIGKKGLLTFSFAGKPGAAYTVRLPSIMKTRGWMTDFHLVRALLTQPLGTARAFGEIVQFDDTKTLGMMVLSSCYEDNVATMYYSEQDMSPTAGCQIYLDVPREAWSGGL